MRADDPTKPIDVRDDAPSLNRLAHRTVDIATEVYAKLSADEQKAVRTFVRKTARRVMIELATSVSLD